jgi:chaperonin GroES
VAASAGEASAVPRVVPENSGRFLLRSFHIVHAASKWPQLEPTMNVRPLYDRVLVKRVESEAKSKGGLFLPDSAQEKPSEGLVLAVGHGRIGKDGDLEALSVKAGDRVVFGRYAGTEIKVDGEERLVLREDEIFGIVES